MPGGPLTPTGDGPPLRPGSQPDAMMAMFPHMRPPRHEMGMARPTGPQHMQQGKAFKRVKGVTVSSDISTTLPGCCFDDLLWFRDIRD